MGGGGGNVGTNLPPLLKHPHNFVTLQSHTVISFQCITLKLGNFTELKALF